MLRSSLTTLGVVLLGATALAQTDLRSLVRPITSPVKNAGTLNLTTGQWTRANGGQVFATAGPDIVYANTCFSGYYGGMGQVGLETWTDEGAIPKPGTPQTPSISVPGGFDTEPGCADTYLINGFLIGYCTFQTSFSCDINFYDQYQQPGTFCTVPGAPTATFVITGLPASTAVGIQACWTVGFDLSGGTGTFTLEGTDDPLGAGRAQFGWSFTLTGPSLAATPDGPIIAGGVSTSGSPLTCTGVDSTRWDIRGIAPTWPSNVSPGPIIPGALEEGSGMMSQDAFRTDGATTAPSGPGCYYFGGNPTASFHLELYAAECVGDVGVPYCGGTQLPGCPCGPPTNTAAGCQNTANTGGAQLSASLNSGVEASIADDSNGTPQVQLNVNFGPTNNAISLTFQGANQQAPVPFANGFNCVSQTIRLNGAPPPPGDFFSASGFVTYPQPAPPHNASITVRSASVGISIQPGQKFHYQTAYRDAIGGVSCNPPNSVNWSNALSIQWGP